MHDTDLSGRVRALLREHPGSQREFAELIGMEQTKLSKSLSGTRRFTAAELTRIAGATGVTVQWLLSGTEDDPGTAVAVPQRTARSGDRDSTGRYQQILDATWRLVAERGYHAVRVADVARACGTSAATIHYHFPARGDLLTETLRYSVRLAFDRQVAELHSIDDAHERLLRLVELQLPAQGRLRQEWSIWLQVWNESALDPDLRVLHSDSYARWHDTIARTLREGQRQGVFTDRDAEELAVTLTALIDGLGIQVLAGRPGRSVERMRRVLHEFIQREVLRTTEGNTTWPTT
ncbi:TetR/AcrR family transcriptional regulator [Saccharopolyspora cebuensis]|uniref:TetR/AcrR family transcriptional regulator n=2 Tax=Pseudonocardiaceae TaxID=2070 RepID=A0ABV4CFM8_9PSEU